MKVNAWIILLMSAHLTACAVPGTEKYQTSMDSVTAEKISRIIQSDVIPYKGENHGEVISRVSSAFSEHLIRRIRSSVGPAPPKSL